MNKPSNLPTAPQTLGRWPGIPGLQITTHRSSGSGHHRAQAGGGSVAPVVPRGRTKLGLHRHHRSGGKHHLRQPQVHRDHRLHLRGSPGKNPRILKSGETSAAAYAELWQTITSGKEWHGEFHNRKKNGDLFWEWAVISPIFDEAGAIIHFLAVKEDITGRKLAETKLAESRNYLDKIINAAADPIFVKDRQHRWVLVNDACCHFAGRKREELLGKSNYDFFSKGEADIFWAKDEAVFNTGKENINEEQYTGADGAVRIIITKKTLYTDEKGERFIVGIISDITGRKRVEEKNLQLAAIVRSSDDAIIGKTLDGIITSWNRGAEKIYGYKEDEIIGKSITLLIPAGQTNDLPLIADRIRRGEQVEHYETLRQRKDGRIINVAITVSPVKNIAGETIGASVVARDITKGKQAELALSDNEKFLSSVIDNIPHMIFVKDAKDLRFLKFNKAGEELLGYAPKDLVGKNDYDLFPKEVADHFTENDRRVLSGNKVVDIPEESLQTRDKGKRILHTKKIPVFDNAGQLVYLLGISEDITGRKQMEAELDRERDLWRMLLDNSPDHIYFKDAQSRFIKSSNAQARQFGVESPDEMVGKTDFDFFAEAHARPAFEDEQEIIRTGRPIIAKEEREVWNDGHVTWASSTKLPMRDDSGKIVGIVGVSRDITERKQMENTLLESQALYHSLVEHLPAGVFRKDAEGRYVFVNSWFCRLKGVKAELFLGKKPHEVAAAELAVEGKNIANIKRLADQGADHHQQIMQTGRQIEMEEHGVDTDGKEQHLQIVKSPIFGSDGKIVGTQGIMIDITGRKRVEEALRESTALYHSLVEQMPTGVFRKDRAGRYVFVNSWFCQLRGLRADQMVGRTPDELAAAETVARSQPRAEIIQLLHDGNKHHEEILRTGKPIHVEEVYPTVEGGKRYLHVMKSAVFGPDGEIVGTQGIQFDVTERKQADEKIQEQAALLNEARDAIWVIDPYDRISYLEQGRRAFLWVECRRGHRQKPGGTAAQGNHDATTSSDA